MSLMTTGLPLAPELSDSGTEMMTPLPVPIHSRWRLIIIDVMRTNENPNFPVPFFDKIFNKHKISIRVEFN